MNEKKNEKTVEQAVKKKSAPYTPQYGVIVLCDSESHQEQVYNKLKKEDYKCRVVAT